MEMLQRFFANNENNIRPQDIASKWYLKPHAKNDFFSWVNQWSLSVKNPNDLGFNGDKYILPNLTENTHFVKNENNWIINGQIMMFNSIAKTMSEVAEEQKGTIKNRCEKAVQLTANKVSVYWANYNDETELLSQLDKEAVEVKGPMSVDQKEDILMNFAEGNIKRLITKPKITSFGLNWQHCNHTVYFPTWSYEQYYQAVRRFWRFGQTNEVTVERVLSDGQKRVLDALSYKTEKAKEFQKAIKENLSKNLEFKYKEFNKQIIKPNFI